MVLPSPSDTTVPSGNAESSSYEFENVKLKCMDDARAKYLLGICGAQG